MILHKNKFLYDFFLLFMRTKPQGTSIGPCVVLVCLLQLTVGEKVEMRGDESDESLEVETD